MIFNLNLRDVGCFDRAGSRIFLKWGNKMGNLKIGSMVSIIDQKDGMKNQIGAVVYYDQKRDKILVRFGGQQQMYYTLDQLKEY